jgi:hypothetical protein
MMKFSKFCLGVLVLLLTCLTASMSGQSVSTSQVSGVVQDESGALVPGAQVTLTQTETGQVHKVTSNSAGSYIIPDLPSGPYNLEVTASGFSTYVEKGIVITVGTNPSITVKLTVGQVTQQVIVEAAPGAQVETQSNGIGQVIDQTQVVELPLNGRDPTQLIALAGATTAAPGGDLNSNKNFPTVTLAVAGGLPNGVAYVLDGGSHNDPFNNLNMPLPFPDVLQEFKVETSALPAQYGDHAAAAVNSVTKSGGNSFHGDAFWFVRNYVFNAGPFFGYQVINGQGIKTRDSLKRNQFGGYASGPIIKNKLFFLGGYEGTIVRSNPPNAYVQVPTQAMMNGDFSVVTSAPCQKTPQVLSAPFATVNGVANQINPSAFSSQALAALKFMPVAGSAGHPDQSLAAAGVSAACGYISAPNPANFNEKEWIGKVDYAVTERQQVFFRYFYANYNSPVPANLSNVLVQNEVSQSNTDQSGTFGHTMTITPNLVNAIRATGRRIVNLRVVDPFFDPSTLGINAYNRIPGYMALSVTGGFGLGGGTTNPGYFNTTAWQFVDDVSYVRGRHQFTTGVDYIYALMSTVNNRPANGIYSFSGAATSCTVFTGTTCKTPGTYGYADFFTGRLLGFSQGNPDLENDGQTTFALYAQDSWKPKKNLTVNYGLRWEPYLPEHNSNNRVENFSLANFIAGTKSTVYTNAPAGMIFNGDPGYPSNHYTFGNKAIFEPRVGFIWDPFNDGKTSVRGGYGIFHDSPQMFFNTRYSNSPPYGTTISLSPSPTAPLPFASPWTGYPGGNPFPALNTPYPTVPFPTGGVYVNSPLHIQPMYLEQWNLSIQRQVNSWLFGATYIGNRTVHLTTSYEVNPSIYDGVASLTSTNYAPRRFLNKINPTQGAYYATIGQYDDGGIADYNGMLISVQRRAKQMNIQANYTWAHCLSEAETTELTGPSYRIPPAIDPNGRRQSYSNCDSDRRQVANVSVILNTPTFANNITRMLATGWQLSTIFTATTGGFFSVTTGLDNALIGTGSDFAINAPNPYSTSTTRFGTTGYLVPNPAPPATSPWGSPAPGTFGPGRPLSLSGPGNYELDMSLSRTFNVWEAQKLQFRWEAFNVPNEAIFSNPSSALNSTTFGSITTTARDPRIMQIALKYLF